MASFVESSIEPSESPSTSDSSDSCNCVRSVDPEDLASVRTLPMAPRLMPTSVAFRDFPTALREPPTSFADPMLSLLIDTGARLATRTERRTLVVAFFGANFIEPIKSNAKQCNSGSPNVQTGTNLKQHDRSGPHVGRQLLRKFSQLLLLAQKRVLN